MSAPAHPESDRVLSLQELEDRLGLKPAIPSNNFLNSVPYLSKRGPAESVHAYLNQQSNHLAIRQTQG